MEARQGSSIMKTWDHEVRNLESLMHVRPKHVVHLYGSGIQYNAQNEPAYFLVVMENMGGGSLRRLLDIFLQRVTDPKLIWALTWCLHVALGIQECHSVGIIHGDIKADNVLLTSRHESETGFQAAKLGDFGGARLRQSHRAGPEVTSAMSKRADTQDGTLQWQAPELLKDRGAPTKPPSDVYSWAITAWEILSCRMPYAEANDENRLLHNFENGEAVYEVIHHHVRPTLDHVRNGKDWAPGQRDAVLNLLQRAWAADPRERPTIDEVVSTLQSLIGTPAT